MEMKDFSLNSSRIYPKLRFSISISKIFLVSSMIFLLNSWNLPLNSKFGQKNSRQLFAERWKNKPELTAELFCASHQLFKYHLCVTNIIWSPLNACSIYLVDYEIDHKKDGVRAYLLKRDQAKYWRNGVSSIYEGVWIVMECAIRQTEISLSQLGSYSLLFAGQNGKLPGNAK